MAPVVGEQFDGWNQATATDGKYKGGDHIPGMNVGGWYDAGDFDLEEPAQLSVIQSLALAYREFHLTYDELTVDESAREVEMHRPDGVPDTVQQVKHGALLILAQFHNIGHAIRGTHEPDLRQYTQVGDGASKTDGRIYDPKLGPNETQGDYSGRPDDRWIFTTNNPFFQWNAIAALAAAADTLKGWDDALARDCLDTAIKAWNEEKAHPTQNPAGGGLGGAAPAARREVACWPRRRAWSLALKAVVTQRAARALRQARARPAHNQLRRPAPVVGDIIPDWSGQRRWN